jgi:hypothetical protein
VTGKGAEQSLIHAGASVASGDDLDLQSFHGVRQLTGEDYIAILQGSTAKQTPATPFAIAVFADVFNGDPDEAIVVYVVHRIGAIYRCCRQGEDARLWW